MHVPLPKPLSTLAIKSFGKFYQIDFSEAEKPVSEYKSIGDFFVRRLKPGVRPIAEGPIVHPADSFISQIGEIQSGKCIQAKDRFYSVAELCGDFKLAQEFDGGLFVTYYLCPTDYHRVHSPVDGQVLKSIHLPGQLWPVNHWSTANIENLFAVNERVVLEIHSRQGPCLLVFVGATNVGQIRLFFDQEIATNTTLICPLRSQMRQKSYPIPIPIQKGEELGAFHMGSTVVMIYPKTIRRQRMDWGSFQNKKVKLGESFL